MSRLRPRFNAKFAVYKRHRSLDPDHERRLCQAFLPLLYEGLARTEPEAIK